MTLLLCVLTTMTAWAQNEWAKEEHDGIWYMSNSGGGYSVVKPLGNSKYSGHIVIPSIVNGKAVTGIYDAAFGTCTDLLSVSIPSSVTSIGSHAFYGCTSLTTVTIPEDANISYGDRAFVDCSSLTSMNIQNGVIGKKTFWNCSGMTSVTFGSGVTSIGEEAFQGCTGLTTLYIPKGDIGQKAFSGCTSLQTVTFGTGVTSIGYGAFLSCDALTSVTIPVTTTTSSEGSFDVDGSDVTLTIFGTGTETVTDANPIKNGDHMFTKVIIGDGITAIADIAFQRCSRITSLTIGDDVTSIGASAFAKCRITSVTIGNGVTTIGYNAFYGCKNMTTLTIGNGVTTVGEEAFYKCNAVTDVYCHANPFETWALPAKDFNDENPPAFHVSDVTAWSMAWPEANVTYVGTLPPLALANDADNSSGIDDMRGQTVDVTLQGRTLFKDGAWNTLCLPFDVVVGSGQMAGATAMTMNAAQSGFDSASGLLTLSFDGVGEGSTIAAGTPFIVKWTGNAGQFVENPMFSGVTIDLDSPSGAGGAITFRGTYNVMTFDAADPNVVLLEEGSNTLKYAASGDYLGACRAYFVVDPTAAGEGQTGARPTDYILHLGSLGLLEGSFNQRGDANGDGSISVTDIAVVVNCILQLTNNGGFSEYGADANGDGDITVTDIGVIVDLILGTSGNAASRRLTHDAPEPQ